MSYLNFLFRNILSTSLLSSIIIIFIALIKRLFRHKLSANFHYYIWFIVILRLITPYLPTSSISIFNLFNHAAKTYNFSNLPQNLITPTVNPINTNIASTVSANSAVLPESNLIKVILF